MPCNRLPIFLLPMLFASVINAQTSSSNVLTCQGSVQSSEWITYAIETEAVKGIQVLVDTKACGFDTIPHYVANLEADGGYHWYMTGANSIYSPTKDGFSVFIRWVDHPTEDEFVGNAQYPNPLTVATARDLNLRLN